MKKSMFTAFAVGLCMTASVMAQVPSYVPANGLVGYWPFNENANDESGNGNNGTVNGATLTSDRNGNTNSSYNFDVNNWTWGANGDFIYIPYNPAFNFTEFTISAWVNRSSDGATISPQALSIIRRFEYGYSNPNGESWTLDIAHGSNTGGATVTGGVIEQSQSDPAPAFYCSASQTIPLNQWSLVIMSYSPSTIKIYIDGQLVCNTTDPSIILNTIGNSGISIGLSLQANGHWGPFDGKIDDIGIWNRVLTQQEITNLYIANSCSNDLTISPATNTQNIGGNATFTAATSDANPTYSWQSDFGQGFQTLNNYGNYSGTTSNALIISNVQLSNHNQQIRAISTSGNCIDTSNIATIQIVDTCITNVTVYDTLLTTVTDTLIINTTLSLPAPNNENTILIYPNPASDHITIDNGNFSAMAGYSIKIENNAGQQVFLSAINQAQFYVDLSTWTGNGLYFVHLIDPQNNTVTVRKIVLQ